MLTIRERLVSVAIWTIVATAAITVLFTALTGPPVTWLQVARTSTANAVFSGICVTLCVLMLPKLAPWARMRLPFVLSWAVIAGALALVGTIGSLLAMMVVVGLGLVPVSRFFIEWYPDSWRTSVYFTVIFGLAATVIGELRHRLSSTTVALRTKERDEAEARRLVAEAQLASLESRVDPHFLFNTLNSIAALVRENPAVAERVIEQFASLMRSSLDRRASLVPLSEELALVRSYLEIERVRFGDRLRFDVEAADDVEHALVPRMSLQTLAENAVKYAVSPSREGATIKVSAVSNDGLVRLTVEDDGPGFDGNRLPDGHGLQLLKSRLAMTFGDRAALTTDSGVGRTRVSLTLPFSETPPSAHEPLPSEAPKALSWR